MSDLDLRLSRGTREQWQNLVLDQARSLGDL